MSIFSDALQPYQNKTSSIRNPKKWFKEVVGGQTGSGVNVTERTALTLSAYYDGVNLISNHIAYLPFHVIRKESDGNRTRQPNHALRQLLNWEPNGQMSAFTFKKTMTLHMLNWGNAFAIINKSGGNIGSLVLKKPWETRIFQEPVSGDIIYKFQDEDRPYFPREVLHLHQFSFDGIKGKSIVQAGARERLGGHIAAEKYGETFFGNGTHMGGLLVTEDSLGADENTVNEAKSEVREELDNVYGDPDKGWHRIGILDGKWEYKDMTLPAQDAQLIQRSEATVEDVARWLGVPTSKLKSRQNTAFNTREHEAIDYVQDGLLPRTSIWEQETRRKCITEPEKERGFETSINTKDLMRGDLSSMAEFLKVMVDRTIFTPNDALEFMGEDTFPGGDVHILPKNMTTLENVLAGEADDAQNRLADAIKEIAKENGHNETEAV